jgi:hypothetical protein
MATDHFVNQREPNSSSPSPSLLDDAADVLRMVESDTLLDDLTPVERLMQRLNGSPNAGLVGSTSTYEPEVMLELLEGYHGIESYQTSPLITPTTSTTSTHIGTRRRHHPQRSRREGEDNFEFDFGGLDVDGYQSDDALQSATYESLLDLADRIGPAKPLGATKEQIEKIPVKKLAAEDLAGGVAVVVGVGRSVKDVNVATASRPSTSSSASASSAKVSTVSKETQHLQSSKIACAICMDEYAIGDEVMDLKKTCGHWFHKSCGAQWFERSVRCPTCRTEII